MADSKQHRVRVKLLFDNFHLEPSWFSVSLKQCKTILDVEQRIVSKFDLCPNNVKLILADCRLPPWENAVILRDNDTLHVIEDHPSGEKLQQHCAIKKNSMEKKLQTTIPGNKELLEEIEDPVAKSTVVRTDSVQHKEDSLLKKPTNITEDLEISTIEQKKQKEKVKGEHLELKGISTADLTTDTGSYTKKKRKRKRKNKNDRHDEVSLTNNEPNFATHTYKADQSTGIIGMSSGENEKINVLELTDEGVSTDVTSAVEESSLSSGIKVYTRQKRRKFSQMGDGHSREEELETGCATVEMLKNYSQFPDMEAPPCKGIKIAYKVVELLNGFEPTVSMYKEAHVVSYDPISTVATLQLLTENTGQSQSRTEVDVDAADHQVLVEWSSLIVPKLLP